MNDARIFDKIDFGVLSDLLIQEDIRDINCLNHNEKMCIRDSFRIK